MRIKIAETTRKFFLVSILASTLLTFGVSWGNPEDPEQRWVMGPVAAPTGESYGSKKCVELHDLPEANGGPSDCIELNESPGEGDDPREFTEVHSWFAVPEASTDQHFSHRSEGTGDIVRQTLGTGFKEATTESGPTKTQEEDYIVIKCGEEREFPLSGMGSARRKVRFTMTINPNLHLNDDHLIDYCRAKKPRLCRDVIWDAEKKAVAECRRQGRQIAGKARCGETVSSGTDAGIGSGGKQSDLKPHVHHLRCAPLDLPTKCDWSCRILSDRISYRKYHLKWRDANGKIHRSCGYRPLRKLTWECTAEVRYVKAAGSLKLSCPAKADEVDTPSDKRPALRGKPKPRLMGVVEPSAVSAMCSFQRNCLVGSEATRRFFTPL